jgi:glycosyltransferase involved in cell wall biosynthesis
VRVSSGIQRTLKFATHLREQGWEPMILTVHPRAYAVTSPDQLAEIPPGMVVSRAFALDAGRHLAVAGRYPQWLALPDRYSSWLLGGLWAGLRLIRRHRPQALWSTFPVATAHLLGGALHRLTGLPWIADFRDSMTEDDYPPEPRRWRVWRRIEHYTVAHAARCVFTTEGTRAMYAARYPTVPPGLWSVIRNGFDEDSFAAAAALASPPPPVGRPVRLVHAGILYPWERDPTAFFEALRRLKMNGTIDAARLRVVLRATSHDETYRPQLAALGIDDLVELAPVVSYREALAEMLTADGLLLFQAANCNHQVPAKLYEYLRAGRPILALTDPAGDTAAELRSAGIGTIVPLGDADAIAAALPRFVEGIVSGRETGAAPDVAARYSRRHGAVRLAALLDEVVAGENP